jgi:hypothetical protein
MGASHKVKILKLRLRQVPDRPSWETAAPRVEALAPFRLIGRNGTTVSDLEELIAIPPDIGDRLREYVRAHP